MRRRDHKSNRLPPNRTRIGFLESDQASPSSATGCPSACMAGTSGGHLAPDLTQALRTASSLAFKGRFGGMTKSPSSCSTLANKIDPSDNSSVFSAFSSTGPLSPPDQRKRSESKRRLASCLSGPWQEKHSRRNSEVACLSRSGFSSTALADGKSMMVANNQDRKNPHFDSMCMVSTPTDREEVGLCRRHP